VLAEDRQRLAPRPWIEVKFRNISGVAAPHRWRIWSRDVAGLDALTFGLPRVNPLHPIIGKAGFQVAGGSLRHWRSPEK
jgi:hypothetical protein